MSHPKSSDRKQAFQAARRRRQHLQENLARRLPSPQSGDIVQIPIASDAVIAWVLVGDERGPARIWAVPADDHVLVGPGDLALPPSSPCGPLVLRCRQAIAFPVAALPANQRVGFLDPAALGLIQESLQGSHPPPTSAHQETAQDPDYQAWITKVAAARAGLAHHLGQPLA